MAKKRRDKRPMTSRTDEAIAEEASRRRERAKSDVKRAREAGDQEAAREAKDEARRMTSIARRFGGKKK